MMVKARSEEKIKPGPVRINQCLTCPRLENTKIHEQDYNRPRAVRILQLFPEDEEKKKAKKSSVKKKILPERLGPISSKTTSTKEQDNGLCPYVKFQGLLSRASRNLDFNNVVVGTVNKKTDNVDQLDKIRNTEQASKKVPIPKLGISLLAVPNSIKNKHLQGCVRPSTKHLKLDALKKNIPLDRRSAVPIYYSECKTVKNASLNITNKNSASCCKIPNAKLLKKDTCALDESRFKCLGPETVKESECIKRLCNNYQSTEIILPENSLNAKHTSSEMLCIDRNEFMHLQCELENLVSITEENLSKLKSTLKYVTKLLSIPQMTISQSDIFKERETNGKLLLDKEIPVETCKLKQPTEENSKFHDSETHNIIMNDKENVAVQCTDSFLDSIGNFENLENQLDIKHTNPVKKLSPLQNTPVIKNYRQKCPLKEYMSLKSTMSFLQTPDSKLSRQKNNIDGPTVENKSYISNKVLADLQNLYSDSPI